MARPRFGATGRGQETHTFPGVRLYDLLLAASPQFAAAVKDDPINWYVNASAIDGYQAVIAWGEIDPQNEGKDVIVASIASITVWPAMG
jgi:hypothetical protein